MIRTYRSKFIQAVGILYIAFITGVAAEAISIAGSTTAYPVINKAVTEYSDDNPGITIKVSPVGSGVGLQQLIDQKVDIALSSRFATKEELRKAAEKDIYLVPFRMAYDYVIPVVNPRNQVKDLSVQQLKDIYTGKITNWSEVGGKDIPISVVSRETTSGTASLWAEKILQHEIPINTAKIVTSNADMVSGVSLDKQAIGYISRGYLNIYLKPVSIDGTYATVERAINGHYLLHRTLFLFTRGWPQGEILKYINFIVNSKKGQEIINESGLVPINQAIR